MIPRVLITICGRGGSKGIPGKNTRIIHEKPLLHYTFDLAFRFASKHGADIQLSTDSEEIADCAAEIGYTTPYRRPDVLATDTAGKVEVIRQAWKYAEAYHSKQYDFVLDMDITSPFRNLDDLEAAFGILVKDSNALNLFSVNNAARSPYFNMVEAGPEGYYSLVKSSGQILSRQAAPKVYDMNASFYIFTRKYMEGEFQSSITDKSLIYIMPHACFDLDHPIDFTLMELMLRENLLDFKL